MQFKFKQAITALAVVGLVFAVFASPASATSHQDHTGACGTVTHSIKKTIRDWQYLGVQEQIAASLGIHGQDGPIGYQLNQHLVIGKIRGTVTTDNHECNGGGTFGSAGPKTLPNLEGVILKPPPGIGKEACKHPNGKCKKIAAKVPIVFPISCKNPNHKKWIPVWIWVHKARKHHPRHHRKRHTVFIKKVTKDSSGNVIPTPTGTFRFRVNVPGSHSRVVKLDTNPQYVGNYVSGTHGKITEIKPVGKQDWETVSAVTQPMNVRKHKLVIVFVNKEKLPMVPPKEGICNETYVDSTGSIHCGAAECSTTTIIVGNNNTVNNEANCPEEPKKPCDCKPPEEPEEPEKPAPEVEIIPDNSQEFELNETAKEAPICARVRPGAGSTVTGVYLEAQYGSVKTPKSYPVPGEKYCNETYKAPSVLPPFRCTEPGLDASAEWCDVLTWTAEVSNGEKTIKVHKQKQVPIIEETPF